MNSETVTLCIEYPEMLRSVSKRARKDSQAPRGADVRMAGLEQKRRAVPCESASLEFGGFGSLRCGNARIFWETPVYVASTHALRLRKQH
jgi:hypothetical protein